MDHQHLLQGGCSCGRNRYVVEIPKQNFEVAKVFFDNSHAHRRSQATPLSAFLRVPLLWYHSTTEAFMEDETHSSIRRTYTSPKEQTSKRQFCGFCGTPLSYWSEEPASEAEFISLTLGSLATEYLRDLEDLGLLPKEALEDVKSEKGLVGGGERAAPNKEASEGLPWFETMVEGSRLGNMRKTWGKKHSSDGRFQVEWEVTEWIDDGTDKIIPGKRKVDALEERNSDMSGA